ncbi:hypothetical protein Dimus_004219 [Dionaea muscipula]
MARGSSEQHNTKAVEATVGGLVWVRRGNGSWWPGQIMGLDEVSESCLASSKSGTPIKLLGRDDATVDWYNLEKSGLVKTFRCGEYDDCIEKAKASAAASFSKKATKKPKRENAILVALELESAQVHENCSASDHSDSEPCGNLPIVSPAAMSEPSKDGDCMLEETSDFEENSNSPQELSHSGITYEETNGASNTMKKGRKQGASNESADEGSDAIKRMRGLDDLGLGRVRSIRKIKPGGNGMIDYLHCMSVGSLISRGTTVPLFKRKRSQLVHVHELLKRKHRRRTLTKVLDTLVMVPIIFDDDFGEDGKVLRLQSNDESKGTTFPRVMHSMDNSSEISSPALGLGDSSDLFDVPIDIEELHAGCSSHSSSSLKLQLGAFGGQTQSDQHCRVEAAITCLGNEHPNESGSTSPPTTAQTRINQVAHNVLESQSASKWKLKGKRNLRHPSKIECFDVDLVGHVDHLWSPPYRLSHFTTLLHPNRVLYDVDIEVKATYRPQHVPYVSLMSKLNDGKAITGHPVSVEALVDGYCDSLTLLESSDYNPTSSSCEVEVGDDDEEDIADVDYVIKYSKDTTKHQPKPRVHRPASSKKTRRLSSLTGSTHEKIKSLVQSVKGPTLACIPLKIVFSRINEALNGSHRSLPIQKPEDHV